MARYKIITLVDITRTQSRKHEDSKRYSQQSNFNTLVQTIGLRANPAWNSDPTETLGSLPNPFTGKARYWLWEFDVEREDVFAQNDDPVFLLKEDMHGVPVISGLDETVDIDPSIFSTFGDNKNTHIEII